MISENLSTAIIDSSTDTDGNFQIKGKKTQVIPVYVHDTQPNGQAKSNCKEKVENRKSEAMARL